MDPKSTTREPNDPTTDDSQTDEPTGAAHILAWQAMTSGMEDYAAWQLRLKDNHPTGNARYRRGFIWT